MFYIFFHLRMKSQIQCVCFPFLPLLTWGSPRFKSTRRATHISGHFPNDHLLPATYSGRGPLLSYLYSPWQFQPGAHLVQLFSDSGSTKPSRRLEPSRAEAAGPFPARQALPTRADVTGRGRARAWLAMAEPTVCSFLTKVLCAHGGRMLLQDLRGHVELSPARLGDVLQRAGPERFLLQDVEAEAGGARACRVVAVSSARLCARYQRGECRGCDQLHFCRRHMLGKCPHRDCW